MVSGSRRPGGHDRPASDRPHVSASPETIGPAPQPGVVSWADLREDLVEEAAALEKQVEPGFPVFAVKLTRS